MPDAVVLDGHKYACIALQGVAPADIPTPVTLASGLQVLLGQPFEIDDNWITWLGTLRTEPLEKCDFAMLVEAPSEAPGVVDDENETLRTHIWRVYYGLLMQGIWPGQGLELTGANHDGRLTVRSVHVVETLKYPGNALPVDMTRAMIERAELIAEVLDGIYAERDRYARLKRGFRVWIDALSEGYAADRLHQHVRSLDGLMKLPRGGSQGRFVHNVQTFLGASPENRKTAEQLYVMRSCREHMHEWDCGLEDILEEARHTHAMMRALQAELIANYVFERVLTDNAVRAHFVDDAAIEAFWSLEDHERSAAWGPKLNLEEVTTHRFVPDA